jgi:hypothetical protein
MSTKYISISILYEKIGEFYTVITVLYAVTSIPPIAEADSKHTASTPFSRHTFKAEIPDGPAPTIATRRLIFVCVFQDEKVDGRRERDRQRDWKRLGERQRERQSDRERGR